MPSTNSFMASSSKAVKILEVTKISPFTNNTTGFSLPLSFFDIMWFKCSPVDQLYFYQIQNLNFDSFNSQIIPELKNSLSLALLHYLPITGNLTWPSQGMAKPIIRYAPGDGIFLTVAKSNKTLDFNRISGYEPYEAVSLHHLVPPLTSSYDAASLLAFQVTLFPNHGFSIGASVHHGFFDARSFTNFMLSWAYLCKLQQNKPLISSLPPNLTPIFDRSFIKDPISLDMLYLDQLLQHSKSKSLKISQKNGLFPLDLVRATFKLTSNEIIKLREIVVSKWDRSYQNTPTPYFSTFVLSLAYIITCRVKSGENLKTVACSLLVDYRKRLDSPALETYFGNCVGVRGLGVGSAIDFMDGENGLVFAAKLIYEGIMNICFDMDGEVQREYICDFIDYPKEKVEGHISISLSGSTKLDYYGSDFGWGRPKKMEIVSIDRYGAVSLIAGRDGIEFGLALEKQELERFGLLFNSGLRKLNHRRSLL